MCDCNNKSNSKPVKGTVPTWSQNWLFLCKGLSVCLGEMISGSSTGASPGPDLQDAEVRDHHQVRGTSLSLQRRTKAKRAPEKYNLRAKEDETRVSKATNRD